MVSIYALIVQTAWIALLISDVPFWGLLKVGALVALFAALLWINLWINPRIRR